MTRFYFVMTLTFISYSACMATKPIDAPIETVGSLAPSYHSIAVQPIHASTDLTPKKFVGTDSEETEKPISVEVIEPDSVPKSAHGF